MYLFLSLILSLIFGVAVIPLSLSTSAKFRGVIVDANKGRVPKVNVLIENAENKWNLQSDEDGEFKVNLPPGEYKFTLDPPRGFKKHIVTNFQISEGATVNYEFEIEVGECSDCDWIIEEPEPTPTKTTHNS